MARKGRAERRSVEPDPIFGREITTKFINKLMWDGKKGLAQRIFYEAMARIQSQTGEDPLDLFLAAVDNAKPSLEVRPRRVGGATYQVPMEVDRHRQQTLAIRWLLEAARSRPERTMSERLANELMDASNGTGGAVRRKEDIHRMAEANKAFAHYRW